MPEETGANSGTLAPAKPTFVSSLANIISGQIACALVALLTEVTYARFLGPALRGLISLCLMSVGFGTLIGGLGGEGSIVFWSSRKNHADSFWLPAVVLWGMLGALLASALWVLAYWGLRLPFLRGISPASAGLVLANLPAAILFSYAMALLTGAEEFRMRSGIALLRQVVGFLGYLLFLLFAGRSAEAALWGYLIGLLTAGLAVIVLERRKLRGFWRIGAASHNLKPTLLYGLRGHVGNLATFFTYRLDVFVVNYFLPTAQLGFYALGVVISESLWQIPQAAASALFPRTARTQERDAQEASRFTCFVLRQVLLIACFCGLLLAALSPFAIPLIFGARFKSSVSVLLWILPGTIALSLGKVACSDLAGRGKNGYSSVFALICFAITIGLDWFLIPRMGILGAALASSVAYFVDAVLILTALRYELRVTWKDLLVPTAEEFVSYRSAWNRVTASVRSSIPRKTELPAGLFSLRGE
ncbi:MAG: oligosaccharide flippase family protein [Acidobacteriia bacterium]|nr:oligosaccharide flippase family protein [Terriglobia bacterium]